MKRLLSLLVVLLALAPLPAHAAFPGQNGKIVFHRTAPAPNYSDIYSVNADGTGVTNLTPTSTGGGDYYPAWSPDGRKIAFSSLRDSSTFELYTMNADGTDPKRITNSPMWEFNAAWSPDGTQLAFSGSPTAGSSEIYTMNADGAGVRQLTNDTLRDDHPAWSPDGQRIAFAHAERVGGPGCTDPGLELHLMNADGTAQTQLTDSLPAYQATDPSWSPDGQKVAYTHFYEDCEGAYQSEVHTINADGTNDLLVAPTRGLEEEEPAWSPDGQKIVWESDWQSVCCAQPALWVMNPDGSSKTQLTSPAPQWDDFPDWQPIPHQSSPAPSYDHPRLAGPIKLSLVPNFRQTISSSQCTARSGLNSNHGPPLAFASCNPPAFVPSTIAHMGPGSSSWASYAVIYGDTNAANGDQANMTLRASMNDIRTAAGADYSASLTMVTKLRITDRNNGGSQTDPATVSDFETFTPIACTATAGPEGASCNLDSSLDAQTPGAIKENKATVVQVFRFRVNDSGVNGTRGDADDRTFAVQGIYIS